MTDEEWLDGDGYPTEAAYQRIKNWPVTLEPVALLDFIGSLWKYPDRWTVDDGIYTVSTGGWSGNEDLLAALRENPVYWMTTWVKSVRGGHYVFAANRAAVDRAFDTAFGRPAKGDDAARDEWPSTCRDYIAMESDDKGFVRFPAEIVGNISPDRIAIVRVEAKDLVARFACREDNKTALSSPPPERTT